jgi:DNA-binding CsgD family transcriptional regulator
MRFDLALPLLKRSLELDARIVSLRQQKSALADTLDVLSDPVIVVSHDMHVLHLNARAAALIGSDLGLRLKHGKLCAVHPAENSALKRIVAGASVSDVELGQTAVLRSVKGLPTLVRAYRLPAASVLPVPTLVRQCALIFKTGSHLDSGVDTVLRSFGLTGAELKLVRRLLQGARLRDCAQEAGVSTETVRSQLKSAHQKVGVRRQSELIRLLSQYTY